MTLLKFDRIFGSKVKFVSPTFGRSEFGGNEWKIGQSDWSFHFACYHQHGK